METGLIQPWDTAPGADDLFVPKEIEDMTQKVLPHYDLKVSGIRLVTAKPDKGGAIWQMETDKGSHSLKLLHRYPARSLFSIYAQEYLVNKGARVAPFVRTKTGQMSVEYGGKLWIVNKWIPSLAPVTKIDLQGSQELCYGLGEFHKHSQGYMSPKEAKKSSRLYRWPKAYQKILTKLGWFKVVAKLYSDLPASQMILNVVDKYEQQAREALQRLENSPYSSLTARGEHHWGIVHQDYGWSNGQLGPEGVWIIDLDGVSYDLPIRDLRKLITSTMDDMGVWDIQWMRGMIEAYHQANPIEPELYQVLLIDMALPNEFYKLVKEMVYSPSTFLTAELNDLILRLEKTDSTKWLALQELSSGLMGGKSK